VSGTVASGLKAKKTIYKKYGPDFYVRLGKKGGAGGRGHTFAHGKADPHEVGKLGGSRSATRSRGKKRPIKVMVCKGFLHWYYKVVTHSNKTFSISQRYWNKADAVREATKVAHALDGKLIIKEK
jgi:general stress protein YciG